MSTHTVAGPCQTSVQQRAGASSEDNTEQSMNKIHWNTEIPLPIPSYTVKSFLGERQY